MFKYVVASGYFNPLHGGHIDYLKEAKTLGDCLVVIVNNDDQVKLKGSTPFMNENERLKIIRSLRFVDLACISMDRDKTICKTLMNLEFPHAIFAKGGDSNPDNVPEMNVCKILGIEVVFNVGGEKKQSSSWLLGDRNGKDSNT